MSALARMSEPEKAVAAVAELAGVVFVAPWLVKLAADPKLDRRDRVIAGTLAIVLGVADGWLLYKSAQSLRHGSRNRGE